MHIGQFSQPITAAEQFNIEHQLITGRNTQLLIDAVVVLFYRVDANKGEVGNVCCIVSFDVIVQNPPLRKGKSSDLFRESLEQILHAGRQCAGSDSLGVQLGQHLDADNLSARLDNTVIPEHTVKQQKDNLGHNIGHG